MCFVCVCDFYIFVVISLLPTMSKANWVRWCDWLGCCCGCCDVISQLEATDLLKALLSLSLNYCIKWWVSSLTDRRLQGNIADELTNVYNSVWGSSNVITMCVQCVGNTLSEHMCPAVHAVIYWSEDTEVDIDIYKSAVISVQNFEAFKISKLSGLYRCGECPTNWYSCYPGVVHYKKEHLLGYHYE